LAAFIAINSSVQDEFVVFIVILVLIFLIRFLLYSSNLRLNFFRCL